MDRNFVTITLCIVILYGKKNYGFKNTKGSKMLKIIIERIKTLKCVVLRRETASYFYTKKCVRIIQHLMSQK